MSMQVKDLELAIEARLLTASELVAQFPDGHDIFRPEDWLRALDEDETLATPLNYWDWLEGMLARTDLDPTEGPELLAD